VVDDLFALNVSMFGMFDKRGRVVEVTRCTAFDFLAFVHFLEVLCCRGFWGLSELCKGIIETVMKEPFVTLLCRFAEMSVAYDQSSVSQSRGGKSGMTLPSRDD